MIFERFQRKLQEYENRQDKTVVIEGKKKKLESIDRSIDQFSSDQNCKNILKKKKKKFHQFRRDRRNFFVKYVSARTGRATGSRTK